MAAAADKDEALKRLGGGRWQTRDARFTIEPQSGTWVVVDGEQVDDLGLPLVRGPFGSLGAAKAAIAVAREAEPVTSPLPARAKRMRGAASATGRRKTASSSAVAKDAKPVRPDTSAEPGAAAKPGTKVKPATKAKPATSARAEATEPSWISALEDEDRRRARRLLERLTAAGAPDAEGIVRRDVVGNVPAVATFAVARRIAALGPAAPAAAIAGALLDGRDEELGIRWRLVDGAGRPITLDLGAMDPTHDP